MDEYIEAFKYLQKIIQYDANPKLFHLAHNVYKDLGRGAITILYTQPSEVFNATGLSPAQFLPKQLITIEEGKEVAEACDNYDPEKQFVIVITMGRKNDPDKECIQNTMIVDYIGKEFEEKQKKSTLSIYEIENRLNGQKSWRCDYCGQRRKIQNFIRDPIIKKLVYCNKECYEKGWKSGGNRLVSFYLENKHAFNTKEGTNEIKKGNINLDWGN